MYEAQDHWVSLRTRFRHRQLYSRRRKNQAKPSDMSHFDFEDGKDDNISVAWFGDEGKEVMYEHDSDHDLNREFNDHSRGDFVDEEKWEIT